MKLTAILIFAFLMQVSAAGLAQKITLNERNASLESVMEKIRSQTGYEFIFNVKDVDNAKKISLNVKGVELADVLDQVFKDQALSFSIDDKFIVLKPKAKTFLERLAERWAAIDVNGRVVDTDGKALPGATVKVKGTNKATSTDYMGNFYLKGVEQGTLLVVSYTGYVSKELKAYQAMGNILLEASLSKLDEVQVIAYGTTTQRLSTGNVTSIKADVIEKQPVNNPLLALQGRVPGLFIEQATGFAGTGVKVRIQGQNSIANGNDPLYVIDGIPFISQLLPINSSSGMGPNYILGTSGSSSFGNPLSFINPSDIESIDVLKDADATAIYGSRAANGAIIITTKKGIAGQIRLNANINSGVGRVSRNLPLMNASEYIEMRKQALKNDGKLGPAPSPYGDSDLNGDWDNKRSANWQKELLGGSAHYTDLQTSISGGNTNATFLTGAGYHKEGNVFPGDFSDIKSSVHFSLNSSSNNQRFKFQVSGSYLEDDNSLPLKDLTNDAMTLSPVAPNLFNLDGSLNWQPVSGYSSFAINPMWYLFSKLNSKTNNLFGTGLISYEIIPGLEIKGSFGYNKLQSNSKDYQTAQSASPENMQYYVPTTNFSESATSSWSVEPQLSYIRTGAFGNLGILIGSTIQQKRADASYISASGFPTEQLMEDLKSATEFSVLSSINSVYKYNALFGRINYNWSDKYILNFTARRDGSSRFGSENLFHNFGAFGAAWVFSKENSVQQKLKFLNFGKLRMSYGTTGSDQIDDYRFLSLYDALSGLTVPYQGINGYRPKNLTNPYLQWEETKKLQFGLDLGFLKEKILFSANYSRNKSSNQLLQLALPFMTGFSTIASNLAATVQNSGWELMVSSTNFDNGGFKWVTSLNLTIPKNKLVSFDGFNSYSLKSVYSIGESINVKKLYHFLGVDPSSGIFQFQDHFGNPTTAPGPSYGEIIGDNNVILNTDPKYYGGLTNSFEYKDFQIDFTFQFTKQISQNYLFGQMPAGLFGGGSGNVPSWQSNSWIKPGDIVPMQKYTTSFSTYGPLNNAKNSDAAWTDASYIRLKNASISWQIPKNWIRATHLSSCRLYIQGQNLLTITKYYGLDPETKSSLSLPPLRVVTLGVKVGI